MFRFLAMFMILAIGCGPAPRPSHRAKSVGHIELVNHYRDNPQGADHEYRNQAIQVYLPRHAYRATGEHLEAYIGMNGHACLVFETAAQTESALIVTGICRGVVRDGIERANGISFYVFVSPCNVTELNPSR